MNQQLVYTPLAEPFVMGVMSVVAVILSVFSSNLLLLSLVFLYVILIGATHVYMRKVSRVEWEYSQGNSNVFIGETNMCKIKISNKSIFPILNIVFRFKCENKLTWDHDEINKNNTGSNYYMNFNLKGRESVSFDLQAVALKEALRNGKKLKLLLLISLDS